MKTINYSDTQFMTTVSALSSKINDIGTSPAEASIGESNMEAMKKFIELYELMGQMIVEYKALLNLDQDSLKEVGDTIKLQDSDVKNLWK